MNLCIYIYYIFTTCIHVYIYMLKPAYERTLLNKTLYIYTSKSIYKYANYTYIGTGQGLEEVQVDCKAEVKKK